MHSLETADASSREELEEMARKYEFLRDSGSEKAFGELSEEEAVLLMKCSFSLGEKMFFLFQEKERAKRFFSDTLGYLNKIQMKNPALSLEYSFANVYLALAVIAYQEGKMNAVPLLMNQAVPYMEAAYKKTPSAAISLMKAYQFYMKFALEHGMKEEIRTYFMKFVTLGFDFLERMPESDEKTNAENAFSLEVRNVVLYFRDEMYVSWENPADSRLENREIWESLAENFARWHEKFPNEKSFSSAEVIACAVLARIAWHEQDGPAIRKWVEKIRKCVSEPEFSEGDRASAELWEVFASAFAAFLDGTSKEMDAACRECAVKIKALLPELKMETNTVYIAVNLSSLAGLAERKKRCANLVVFDVQLQQVLEKFDLDLLENEDFTAIINERVTSAYRLVNAYFALEMYTDAERFLLKSQEGMKDIQEQMEIHLTQEEGKKFQEEMLPFHIFLYLKLLETAYKEENQELHAQRKREYEHFLEELRVQNPENSYQVLAAAVMELLNACELIEAENLKDAETHLKLCVEILESIPESGRNADWYLNYAETQRNLSGVMWKLYADTAAALRYEKNALKTVRSGLKLNAKEDSLQKQYVSVLIDLYPLEYFNGSRKLARKHAEKALISAKEMLAEHPEEDVYTRIFINVNWENMKFILQQEQDFACVRELLSQLRKTLEPLLKDSPSDVALKKMVSGCDYLEAKLLMEEGAWSESKECVMKFRHFLETFEHEEDFNIGYCVIAEILLHENAVAEARSCLEKVKNVLEEANKSFFSRDMQLTFVKYHLLAARLETADEKCENVNKSKNAKKRAQEHIQEAQKYMTALYTKFPKDAEILRWKKKVEAVTDSPDST